MNIFLWIIAGLLAAAFLASGLVKVVQPKEKLTAAGMGWAEDFGPGTIKLIGVLEILAAIGLVVPAVFGIAPVLVPLSALGLALLMLGAAVVHARRSEYPMVATNIALLVLAAVVAWGRFGPFAFTS
jgi:hypothetical protein